MSKKVLLISDGFIHPPYLGRMALNRALAQSEGFTFRRLRSLERLPASLGNIAALVLYFHHAQISPAALDRLAAFVRNGGGLLGIHSATASFKDQLEYFDILGGRFIGHGPVEAFHVTNQSSQIFSGIPDFTIRDELYLHELNPAIQVNFTARHAGQDAPIVWTYRYGQGKVCYAVPGHTASSIRHPVVQEILRRGLQWVC
jgi:type 1 glutamine amidotransferase